MSESNEAPKPSPVGFALGVIFAIGLYFVFTNMGLGALVSGGLGGGIGMGLGMLLVYPFTRRKPEIDNPPRRD